MIVKLKPDSEIGGYYNLTKDKEYVALIRTIGQGIWYQIKCDDGHIRDFSQIHFDSREEIRDGKLKDLGIE